MAQTKTRNPFAEEDNAPNVPDTFPNEPVYDPGTGKAYEEEDTLPGDGDPFGLPNMDASDEDFVIDLTNVDGSKRQDFIGVGRHLGYVSDVTRETSKAGNPMIVFSCTVYRGEWQGKTRKVYCAITENALWKLDQTLQACGVATGPNERKLSFKDIKTKTLRTMVTMVVIPAGEYEGRPQTNLDSVEAPVEFGLEAGETIPEAGQPV